MAERRKAAERLFAAGISPDAVARRIREAEFGQAKPPSMRTIARWYADRQWVTTGAAAAHAPPA